MRLIHDFGFAMAARLVGIVAGSLTETQAANVRHEFYHELKAGLEQYLEAARLERRRLNPTEGGDR